MSTKINDGGSAFPQVVTDINGEQGEYTADTYSYGGMTLRDWFAGQALAGMLANQCGPTSLTNVQLADLAYKTYATADAMLKEREVNNGTR